jgi:hypothetical protein
MIDHLLQIQVLDQACKSDDALVISPGEGIQFFYRDDLYGYVMLFGEFFYFVERLPGCISLEEDLVYGSSGTDRFDQGLTADDEALATSLPFSAAPMSTIFAMIAVAGTLTLMGAVAVIFFAVVVVLRAPVAPVSGFIEFFISHFSLLNRCLSA